jgi:hypothetical protein
MILLPELDKFIINTFNLVILDDKKYLLIAFVYLACVEISNETILNAKYFG